MTGRNLVIILGFVVVIVSSAGAEECPQGNCTSPASHNNEIERLSTSQEVITQTTAPLPKPQSLDMLAEDSYNVFRPSPNPSSELNTVQRSAFSKEEPKGRALNFTVDEHHAGNILSNFSKHHDDFDLSDVTIGDDEDFDMDLDHHKMMLPKSDSKNSTFGLCEKGGLTYENGEKLENGCDSVCTCKNGNMDCDERCPKPFFRKGKKIDDPLCSAKATEDPCCSVLVCAGDTETEPLEICSYENQTYNRGDIFNKGCAEVCSCEIAGKVYCKSRCPPSNKTNDRCVEVPDPNDSCCKKILCDVTLDDNDPEKYDESHKRKILSAKFVNETTILMKFDSSSDDDAGMVVEISDDKTTWRKFKIVQGGYVLAKRDAKYLRLENTDDIINIQNFVTDPKPGDKTKNDSKGCQYKGQLFKLGDEFNDECTALCVCQEGGMKCLKIQCPTYFGVDVLDPNCVEWETIPPDFTPTPPKCCPERIRCKNNGSCNYKGATYKNWEQVPINITGCEKRCYCEMGHVECQNTCPPVTALPPPNLPCPQNLAKIGHIPEDDCCKYWVCNPDDAGFDGPLFPGPFPPPQDDVPVHTLEAIDPHTVRLAFMVPPVIVNLHGRVEVRYTNDKDDADLDSWMLQVFAPPNDLIATRSLEFDLQDLESDTEYKIKITITLRDIHTTHSSRIYKIKTPREILTSTLPPMIPIEPDLAIIDINATWVTVTWKKFDANELRFIDGVQLRYREIEGKIYAATPLIHRAVTTYTLENLKPNTKYEIGIFFIPFPGQLTELHAEKMLHFTTANEIDTYGFNVTLEISHIKSQSVEISWEGVPYPEDKYVNIYRAIYQSDTGKEDQSMFKIAKRDSATKTVIMDLKPGTRYRLWLEVYLTNGKIKTSNVQEFNTKPRVAPVLGAASQQDKLSRAYQLEMKGDYYGPLVIVAILAAIAIMSTLVLLLILIRRHNQNKAAITPPSRVSQSAYDNPTYKVEIQQETMGKYVCE
ncbi:stranded at second isoform X3 [Leptinotarsa decemlineata]|uniref:stranded at second isoform X3 n=1 Tax=Leptinotarsa decemlineata TaxID=7539 RepID=UPI003D30CBE0